MGYSRSCPRTQAASTRHVSDLTPRSDSRPHQPGLPPKRLSTVGTCSIAAAPCRRNPRQHSTESLFSAQSLPFRSASRSSRKDTGLQPVCPAGSPPLLSPTQQICCLVLPQSATALRQHTFECPARTLLALSLAADEKTMASSQSFRRLSAAAALSCTASLLPSAAAIRDSNPRRLS